MSPFICPIRLTDDLGNNIYYAYDDMGNMIAAMYPRGNGVEYFYDDMGNVL